MLLKAEGINKFYNKLHVLKDVSLQVAAGEIVSIVGASGAGKSTLLHILGTLDRPDTGHLWLNNTDVADMNDRSLSHFRGNNIGFIFQFHNLLPEFNAFENVCLPGYLVNKDKRKVQKRARFLLELLGLADRLRHKPSELSGGEQQRVSVARALQNEPAIVFADEPSGNLDSVNANDLHQLFFKLRNDMGQTFVLVTHNDQLANMADRKLTMQDGKLLG